MNSQLDTKELERLGVRVGFLKERVLEEFKDKLLERLHKLNKFRYTDKVSNEVFMMIVEAIKYLQLVDDSIMEMKDIIHDELHDCILRNVESIAESIFKYSDCYELYSVCDFPGYYIDNIRKNLSTLKRLVAAVTRYKELMRRLEPYSYFTPIPENVKRNVTKLICSLNLDAIDNLVARLDELENEARREAEYSLSILLKNGISREETITYVNKLTIYPKPLQEAVKRLFWQLPNGNINIQQIIEAIKKGRPPYKLLNKLSPMKIILKVKEATKDVAELQGLCAFDKALHDIVNLYYLARSHNDNLCTVLSSAIMGMCEKIGDQSVNNDAILLDFIRYMCEGDLLGVFSVVGVLTEIGIKPEWFLDALEISLFGQVKRLYELLDKFSLLSNVNVDIQDIVDDYLLSLIKNRDNYLATVYKVSKTLDRLQKLLKMLKESQEAYNKALAYLNEILKYEKISDISKLISVLDEALQYAKNPHKYILIKISVNESNTLELCNRSRVDLMAVIRAIGCIRYIRPGDCQRCSIDYESIEDDELVIELIGPGGAHIERQFKLYKLFKNVLEIPLVTDTDVPTVTDEVTVGCDLVKGRVLQLRFRKPRIKAFPKPFSIGGYEVRGLLGIGGMSITLLAVDEYGQSVVLKIPLNVSPYILFLQEGQPVEAPTVEASIRAKEMFEREYKILRSLEHPHIIKVLDYGVDPKLSAPFIVIEYAPNGSLRGVLEEHGSLDLETVLTLGVQVSDALAYLHSRGVVHLDLKPENILFSGDGLMKITDFNIAKMMHDTMLIYNSYSFSRSYTIGYAAPEQIHNDFGEIGPSADIWSLGIILYEAAVGEPPFPRENYENAIREPPSLEPLPGELKDIIALMLNPKPKERPTARQVCKLMVRVLSRLRRA